MALKDHKEELRCARDIAILIKYAADQKRQNEIALEEKRQFEEENARVQDVSGVTWGQW